MAGTEEAILDSSTLIIYTVTWQAQIEAEAIITEIDHIGPLPAQQDPT